MQDNIRWLGNYSCKYRLNIHFNAIPRILWFSDIENNIWKKKIESINEYEMYEYLSHYTHRNPRVIALFVVTKSI